MRQSERACERENKRDRESETQRESESDSERQRHGRVFMTACDDTTILHIVT